MSGAHDTIPTERPVSGVHRAGFTGSQAESALLLLDHIDMVREYLGCAQSTNRPNGQPIDREAMDEWLHDAMAELVAAEWAARHVIASAYGLDRTTPRTGVARALGATVDGWEDALLAPAANGGDQ